MISAGLKIVVVLACWIPAWVLITWAMGITREDYDEGPAFTTFMLLFVGAVALIGGILICAAGILWWAVARPFGRWARALLPSRYDDQPVAHR